MSDNFLYQGKRSFWKSMLFFMAAFSPFILWHFFRITDTQGYKWPFLLPMMIYPVIFSLTYFLTIQEDQLSNLHTKIQQDKVKKITYQKINFITNWYFISIHYLDNKNKSKRLSFCCNFLRGSPLIHQEKIIETYQKLNTPTSVQNSKLLDWIFNKGDPLNKWLRTAVITLVYANIAFGAFSAWIHINYVIIMKNFLIYFILAILIMGIVALFILTLNRFVFSKTVSSDTIFTISILISSVLFFGDISQKYILSTPKQAIFLIDASNSNHQQVWLFENYTLRLRGHGETSQTTVSIPVQDSKSDIIFIQKSSFKEKFKVGS